MSRTQLWTRAADAMREDPDPRWHVVADVLRGEALLWEGMDPFVALLDCAYQQASGEESVLRLVRKEDGEIDVFADNSSPVTRLALTYLGEIPQPTDQRPDAPESEER